MFENVHFTHWACAVLEQPRIDASLMEFVSVTMRNKKKQKETLNETQIDKFLFRWPQSMAIVIVNLSEMETYLHGRTRITSVVL